MVGHYAPKQFHHFTGPFQALLSFQSIAQCTKRDPQIFLGGRPSLRQIGFEATRQRVKQIEAMIADFERMASMLEAAQKSYESKRQADLLDVRQAVDYYKNQTARLMMAANRQETSGQ